MSKFFAQAGGSDSDTESDESEIITSFKPQIPTKTYQLSDDEDEIKRQVRSSKDKREEEMMNIIKQIKNHRKIKDMCKILSDFEELQKIYAKAKGVLDEKNGSPPHFFLRCLIELENFVNECWDDKDAKKSMSKNNSRGLSSLRQKLKKYNKDYETFITNFREKEKLEDFSENEEIQSDNQTASHAEDEEVTTEIKTDHKKVAKVRFDDEQGSTDWEESESDASSMSEDEKKSNLAAKFLKKTTTDEGEKEKKKEKRKSDATKVKKEEDEEEGEDEGKWESVTKGVQRGPYKKKQVQLFGPDEEITRPAVLKKVQEVIASRGRRLPSSLSNAANTEPVALFKELLKIAQEDGSIDAPLIIKISFNLVASYFDYNQKLNACMKATQWTECLQQLSQLIKLLKENPNVKIGTHIIEESEDLTPEPDGTIRMKMCVLSLLELADEEFTKILQNCDAHSTEYLDRLKDEKTMCDLIDELQSYLEAVTSQSTCNELCRIYMRRIEHSHYKVSLSSCELDQYFTYVYQNDDTDRMRTRAILFHIYFASLHDDWFKARDLLLMSHLQDSIQHSDYPTQTLYNRAIVQLGLCAFRHALLKEAHDALLDIQSSGRTKELLGQGILSQNPLVRAHFAENPLTAEQEKMERLRQVPFHMHINLDVIEFVYLFCAMCLETPYIAVGDVEKRKMISKNFYYQLRMSERQLLLGPPDNIRDHVVAAHKAMKRGDWKACRDFIINDKTKSKVWDLFPQSVKICDMIIGKIKQECLRVYLLAYGGYYDTISLKKLNSMFELDIPVITKILNRMIMNDEILASFDETSELLYMHRADLNKLQSLVIQMSDKIIQFSDLNDKLAEIKWYGNNSSPYPISGSSNYTNYSGTQNYGYGNFAMANSLSAKK